MALQVCSIKMYINRWCDSWVTWSEYLSVKWLLTKPSLNQKCIKWDFYKLYIYFFPHYFTSFYLYCCQFSPSSILQELPKGEWWSLTSAFPKMLLSQSCHATLTWEFSPHSPVILAFYFDAVIQIDLLLRHSITCYKLTWDLSSTLWPLNAELLRETLCAGYWLFSSWLSCSTEELLTRRY